MEVSTGKSSINSGFPTAMFDYQRVHRNRHGKYTMTIDHISLGPTGKQPLSSIVSGIFLLKDHQLQSLTLDQSIELHISWLNPQVS